MKHPNPVIPRLCEILGEAGIRCEWPGIMSHPSPPDAMGAWRRKWDPEEVDTCAFFPGRPFGEVCHLRARKWRNSTREDTPGNLAVMCQKHHNLYDRVLGQSPRNQRWLREQITQSRGQWIVSQLARGHRASLSDSKGSTGISTPTRRRSP